MPEDFAPEQLPIPGMDVDTSKPLVFVSKEDRLESANLHLRTVATLREIQLIQHTVEQKKRELDQLQVEILKKRQEIETRYGIDLTKCQIRDSDGLVVPRTSRDGGIAAAMAAARMEQR